MVDSQGARSQWVCVCGGVGAHECGWLEFGWLADVQICFMQLHNIQFCTLETLKFHFFFLSAFVCQTHTTFMVRARLTLLFISLCVCVCCFFKPLPFFFFFRANLWDAEWSSLCAKDHTSLAQSLLFILIIDRQRQNCPSANPLSSHNADSVTEAPVLM